MQESPRLPLWQCLYPEYRYHHAGLLNDIGHPQQQANIDSVNHEFHQVFKEAPASTSICRRNDQ